MTATAKTLLLLKPRGFCVGVVKAIDIVRIALDAFGPPIYVRKEIVHNRYVVEELKAKGAIFVDRSEERRVGKECRCGWSLDHEKKKMTRSSECRTGRT